jgi:hypothetical protein
MGCSVALRDDAQFTVMQSYQKENCYCNIDIDIDIDNDDDDSGTANEIKLSEPVLLISSETDHRSESQI